MLLQRSGQSLVYYLIAEHVPSMKTSDPNYAKKADTSKYRRELVEKVVFCARHIMSPPFPP